MKKVIKFIFWLVLVCIVLFILTNLLIIAKENEKIAEDDRLSGLGADCILILGAGVWEDNEPSPMLRDRLEEGARLYRNGVSPKILVSGDHGRTEYDEVNVMKQYLIDLGIPSEDIFMDHAGFSTYESMVRAKEVFGAKRIVIVTQKYHMYRALYICKQIGINALGATADPRAYQGAIMRNVREWAAREKDVFACMLHVSPKYLGDSIDLKGNGDQTNDKNP